MISKSIFEWSLKSWIPGMMPDDAREGDHWLTTAEHPIYLGPDCRPRNDPYRFPSRDKALEALAKWNESAGSDYSEVDKALSILTGHFIPGQDGYPALQIVHDAIDVYRNRINDLNCALDRMQHEIKGVR